MPPSASAAEARSPIADVRRKDELLFTVASAYAAWEQPPSLSDKYIYADASAHRLLSNLAAILTGRRGEQIVVAGDFNILLGYGEHGDAYWEARYQSVFDRARAMGARIRRSSGASRSTSQPLA